MRKALLLLVVLAGFLAGCENKYKDPDPEAMGYDYYPLEIGNYRIYDVMDIKFRSNVGDTNRFQMRERVDTSFYDQTGQLAYKIIRSARPNENRSWVDDSVLVVSKTNSMVLLTQDNNRFVKMVFPVKEGNKWQADAYNDRISNNDEKEYYVFSNVGEAYEVNELAYPKTITIVQGTPFNNVQLDNRKEVYAEGVGLIYRLFNRAVYCEGAELNANCEMGVEYKQSGHERHEVLVAHGKL